MWILQTPDASSTKLLKLIGAECEKAVQGGAAFAFVTSAGVKLLEAEVGFQTLLRAGKFVMVIGLDAITDTQALEALRSVKRKYPNFEPLAFLHNTPGALFHPKTVWLRRKVGGAVISGSGNLTSGGLNGNWEAASLSELEPEVIDQYEASWSDWLGAHKDSLLELDDPRVLERAANNKIQKTKVKKALQLPEGSGAEDMAGEAADALAEIPDFPVLIAEVPRSGDRWKQVNFDVGTYQNYFGVTLGAGKDVEFREVKGDGTLGPAEERHAVAVASKNYRFEVGAAANLPYPAAGHPILVFQRITEHLFYYTLLMPDDDAHALIQDYLAANYPPPQPNAKRRVVITSATLLDLWPDAPFFA